MHWRSAAALFLVLASGDAMAAPPVSLREVASGLSSPVEAAHASDGTGRLFVVEQAGRIRIADPATATVASTPFLDISSGGIISSGGERGLLGLAFHPQYAANRAFYIYYTKANGNLVLARVLRSGVDANVADPASRVELLEIPHPTYTNHNGGRIAFGPDGLLYIGTGDGGGGGDPFHAAQALADGRGKILRIAVDGGTGYAIAPDNPFASSSCSPAVEFCKEVFHFGLRNPWKFSFDRAGGDLFIGDVGQGAWEEVDYVPRSTAAPVNFGWGVYEGNACYNDTYFGTAGACAALAGHRHPVITYGHDSSGGFSITGGYRYRGKKSHPLHGYYLYADYVSKRVWASRPDAQGAWTAELLLAPPAAVNGISSFAEDESGHLYLVDHGNGKLWSIDGPGPAVHMPTDLNGDARSDLLYRHSTSGNVFRFLMDGFTLTRGAMVWSEPDTAWKLVADADFDGDGVHDLLWRHAGTGQVYVARLARTGFVTAGAFVYHEPDSAWQVAGTPDLDGDGKADILWWNSSTGQVYAVLMDGFAARAQGFVWHEPDLDWRIVGVGDFASSGKRNQVLWRHLATGRLFVMTITVAGGAFQAGGVIAYHEPDTAWKVVGVADFDGDGRSDIAWRHDTSGRVFVLLMNGAAPAGGAEIYREPDPDWKIVAFGDYNGDAKADVLWRRDSTGEVYMLQMNGPAVAAQRMVYREIDTSWRIMGPAEYAQ